MVFRFMMMIAIVFALCVGLGCTPNVDVTKTAKGFRAGTDANNVEILHTRPDRKFAELGSVSTSGWNSSDTAKMHNALRAKAAPLGADAVIILNSGMIQGGWSSTEMWITAVAIRYE